MLDTHQKYALSWAAYETVASFAELNISKIAAKHLISIISLISHENVIPKTIEDIKIIVNELDERLGNQLLIYLYEYGRPHVEELETVRKLLYENILYYLGEDFVNKYLHFLYIYIN